MKPLLVLPVVCTVLFAAPPAARPQMPIPASPQAAAESHPVELDHVVAVIGDDVILESDVHQEMHLSALEPLQVLPGQNTPDSALRRLIDRTLILQQMKEQRQAVTTAAPEVDKAIEELRIEIPACARYHCETRQGWDVFLRDHDLTLAMVQQRWSQRMAIIHFINIRFQSGIRIAPDEITTYYEKVLVPALEKHHEKAPPLDDVSGRIREILLQQQVSGLFQDWLTSLRDQGNVRVVDPAYSADFVPTSQQRDSTQ